MADALEAQAPQIVAQTVRIWSVPLEALALL